MRWFAFGLLACLALAGCSDKAGEVGGEVEGAGGTGNGDGTAPPGESGSGSMVGIVVDDAVRPLAEANVSATGPSGTLTAVTDAEGGFRFDDLAAGVYLVDVTKPFYITHRQAVTVVEGVEPETTRFQLTFEASQVPYANLYKFEGFYECGSYPYHLCANINIATWIVLCSNTNICIGNVTQDRSLFFQFVEPGADFLQGELVWTPTTPTGNSMALLLGGGNEDERRTGMAPAYNATYGASPLMARISNHEGPDSWCGQRDTCPSPDTLNQSSIGTERALLVQVATGPTARAEPLCDAGASPCGTGFAAQQPFTMFTTTFYGYEPPADWLFATTGETPPPPS